MQPATGIRYNEHFSALDGYRALAVTMVFCAHFGGGWNQGPAMRWLDRITAVGVSGVGLFFVLSGFLITGILYDTRQNPDFFRTFYIRRSLRIFPIAYLVMFGCVLASPWVGYRLHWEQLSFLFYLGNIFGHWNGAIYSAVSTAHPALSLNISHFWSLCVEEQFYLIWPVVVYFVRDRVKLIRLAIGVMAVSLLLRIIAVTMCPPLSAGDWAFRQLPCRADDLVLGGCLALLLRGPNSDRWLKRSWYAVAAGVLGFGVIFAFECLSGQVGFDGAYALTIGMDCVSLASAGLIGLCIQPGTLANRIFSVAPLRRIGIYSYGFYVYHLLFASSRNIFETWLRHTLHSVALAGMLTAVVYYFGTLLVAAISYELYERRFLKLKRYFAYAKKPQLARA